MGALKETPLIRFAHLDFYFHLSSLRRAWLGHMKTKIPAVAGRCFFWRRKRDSNPRSSCPDNGFQDRRDRPLRHFSAAKIIFFCFSRIFLRLMSKLQIYSTLQFLLTRCEQIFCFLILKTKSSEQLRHFGEKQIFIRKKSHFNLKVPLFVEKRQNKFAYEFKKNKFVFN
jgi:hypothetical protein